MGEMEEKSRFSIISVWVTNEDREALEKLLENLEVRKKMLWEKHENSLLRKDDPEIWIKVSAPPVPDTAEGLVGSLAMTFSISEHKRKLEEIEILHTDLASRACELEIANHELETFSYTVSHDLRMPLTIINGYCEVILEMSGDNLDEECKGYLRNIIDGTIKMNHLIDTLLKFSHLTRSETHPESVNLSEMTKEIAAELKLTQPRRRVEFNIEEEVTAQGDASLLRVVMENLLSNAWKYTAKKEEALIKFGVTEFNGKTGYFVRDNGAGFDISEADKLFGAFQRLHTNKEFEGIGIGLCTVRRIIHRHGGRVWAEGNVGTGATFYFTLE